MCNVWAAPVLNVLNLKQLAMATLLGDVAIYILGDVPAPFGMGCASSPSGYLFLS